MEQLKLDEIESKPLLPLANRKSQTLTIWPLTLRDLALFMLLALLITTSLCDLDNDLHTQT